MRRLFGGLLLAVAALSPAAAATTLTIRACADNQPFMPLTNTDPARPGDGQILLAMAAARSGIEISYQPASWEDCQRKIDRGEVDAVVAASYAAINTVIARFPMQGEMVDPSRSMGAVRTDLFRRRGSAVGVRNGRFVNLKTRVGIMHAYQANSLSVGRLGGVPDDNSRTMESLAKRLVSGQLDLIAGTRHLRRLCAVTYTGKIERLPEPLDEVHYYFAVSTAFYDAHRDAVERLWNELAAQRPSVEFQARIRDEEAHRAQAMGHADCPVAADSDG